MMECAFFKILTYMTTVVMGRNVLKPKWNMHQTARPLCVCVVKGLPWIKKKKELRKDGLN